MDGLFEFVPHLDLSCPQGDLVVWDYICLAFADFFRNWDGQQTLVVCNTTYTEVARTVQWTVSKMLFWKSRQKHIDETVPKASRTYFTQTQGMSIKPVTVTKRVLQISHL